MSESKSGKAEAEYRAGARRRTRAGCCGAERGAGEEKAQLQVAARAWRLCPGRSTRSRRSLAGVQETIAQQDFYLRPQDEQRETLARLDALQQELDALLERWAELED